VPGKSPCEENRLSPKPGAAITEQIGVEKFQRLNFPPSIGVEKSVQKVRFYGG